MAATLRFRWRAVAASLCGFFGVLCVLAGLINGGVMAYAYARFGLYPTRPDTPSLNRFALRPRNLASVVAQVAAGALLLWACVALWRGRQGGQQQKPAHSPGS